MNVGIGFGTSGLRGLAEGFEPPLVDAYVRAFLDYAGKDARERILVLGMDLRESSPLICGQCAASAQGAGWSVIFAGIAPTPAVASYALERRLPALVITGSHIPEDYNGIKFYRPDGELLKTDEEPIRKRAERLMANASDPHASDPLPGDLPEIEPAVARSYVERLTAKLTSDSLAGMKIGVHMHSAAGRDLMVEILNGCGAVCHPYGRVERFVPVDTEALADEAVAEARQQIQAHGLDCVVSTDGDGDRPLVIDENGNQINGDVLGAIAARYLGIDTVVTPVTSTSALELSSWFEMVVRTRVGSPYVVAAMAQQIGNGERGNGARHVAGFEANGGFLLGTSPGAGPVSLPPLPTRDAMLPIVSVLAAAKTSGTSLSQLARSLPPRFMKADRVREVPAERGHALLRELAESAPSRARIDPRLSDPVLIDMTDGVRLTLPDETVVHFRQSGNAPEMRCYVETGDSELTQTRLGELTGRLEEILSERAAQS